MADVYTVMVSDTEGVSERLDKFITEHMPMDLSRSYVQKLIQAGHVRVNGALKKAHYSVVPEDKVVVDVPEPIAYTLQAEKIPLDIVYEDDDVCVINKAAGMVVHPACGHYSGTLVHALLHHCRNLSGLNGVLRPGIVHRLDKETSGLIIVAKHDIAHRFLADQLVSRSLSRKYLTLVCGMFPKEDLEMRNQMGRSRNNRKLMTVVEQGGKEAISRFVIQERFCHFTLLQAILSTGRTHQIRVHLKHLGYPVLGDPVYSRKKAIRIKERVVQLNRQALHAHELAFIHPQSKTLMTFLSDLPQDIQTVLDQVRADDV